MDYQNQNVSFKIKQINKNEEYSVNKPRKKKVAINKQKRSVSATVHHKGPINATTSKTAYNARKLNTNEPKPLSKRYYIIYNYYFIAQLYY